LAPTTRRYVGREDMRPTTRRSHFLKISRVPFIVAGIIIFKIINRSNQCEKTKTGQRTKGWHIIIMDIINYVGENSIQIDAAEYDKKLRIDDAKLLLHDERVVYAFRGRGGNGRDTHVLTTRRLLMRDKKGTEFSLHIALSFVRRSRVRRRTTPPPPRSSRSSYSLAPPPLPLPPPSPPSPPPYPIILQA
jgi:hypothetical protein